MLLLRIDDTSGVPVYRQILERVRDKIHDRVLRPGDALPSTRGLAAQLGIHRSTVAAAYHELWALGLIDLSPGARPRVRRRPQIVVTMRRRVKGVIEWNEIASPEAGEIVHALADVPAGPSTIDFSRIDIDPRLFPLDSFRASLSRVMRERGAEVLRYGDRAGYLPLREHLAQRLRTHGIAAEPDEILITNGSQQAIDLVLRMIAGTHRPVIVESPTYDHLLPLVRFHGLKAIEIPQAGMDARAGGPRPEARGLRPEVGAGMDLARLEAAMRRHRPALVYTMPNFQNPTGVTTTQAHRERLLALCEAHRVPLLEDGFEEEMKYFGRVVLPVKSMDRHQVVIYCGTLSKVLFPGLRIGWIVAERECIERLAAIRRFSEIAPNMLLQAAVLELYEAGHYDRHVSRMHRVFRRRMQTAIHLLRAHIPPRLAQWNEPAGGFLIWLKLVAAAGDLRDRFAAHGVKVAWGDRFFLTDTAEQYVRLSIAGLDDDQIIEGIRRIAAALRHGRARAAAGR